MTAALAARLATLPRAPDILDSVSFVRGVQRFSLPQTRPHWPGYPVYMWTGKALDALVGDPVLALHLVSALASVLAAWPLARVVRAWASSLGSRTPDRAGWVAAALWLLAPAAWVTAAQIISDTLGLLLGAGLLALAVAGERGRREAWIGAAVVGGLMVGARPVNVTMLGPIAWKVWAARRERWWGCPPPFVLLAALAAGVIPWLGWLLVVAHVDDLIRGGQALFSGHFHQWGRSALTDPHPLLRPIGAVGNLVVYGLGGGWLHRWPRLVVTAAWAVALGAALRQRPWRGPVARQVALWAVPNLAYILFGHDVSYPRYMLTALAVLCLLGGLAVATPSRVSAAAVAAAIASMAAVSAPLAVRQRDQTPVDYRVARFLARQPRAAIVLADLPNLPLFLQDEAPAVVWAYADAAQADTWRGRWEAQGHRVFTTSPPPGNVAGWRPVAHFCRDPLIDPRLGYDAWLFAPVSTAASYPAGDCYTAE